MAEKTPQWGAPEDGPKDAAAPRTWRGVAAANEDWGELNTGKQAPSIYVLDINTWTVHQVGLGCAVEYDEDLPDPSTHTCWVWHRWGNSVVWWGSDGDDAPKLVAWTGGRRP